jgi:hypothetical protein
LIDLLFDWLFIAILDHYITWSRTNIILKNNYNVFSSNY